MIDRISKARVISGLSMTVNPMLSSLSEELSGLRLLIRLRWFFVSGLLIASFIFGGLVGVILPVAIFAVCIGMLGLSNVLLFEAVKRVEIRPVLIKMLTIAADIAILTVMLYFAGGAHNPFTLLYLLFITVAVVLLPQWGAWLAIGLCVGGFLTLFVSPHELVSRSGGTCCNDMTAHLYGMVIGMFVTGAGIATFIGILNRNIIASRKTIAQLWRQGEEMRRTSDVAMLATGIAHELATPLSTIAVISADIERDVDEMPGDLTHGADARLIRQEVERCRKIIEQLGRKRGQLSGVDEPWDWNSLSDGLHAYFSESVLEHTRWHVTPERCMLEVSQIRLFQCLDILVRNARDASDVGTAVELNAEILGDFACFRVTNTGVGFPRSVLDHLGEPFVSGKTETGGLGLGLYLVSSFARAYGGTFTVTNTGPGLTVVELKLRVSI